MQLNTWMSEMLGHVLSHVNVDTYWWIHCCLGNLSPCGRLRCTCSNSLHEQKNDRRSILRACVPRLAFHRGTPSFATYSLTRFHSTYLCFLFHLTTRYSGTRAKSGPFRRTCSILRRQISSRLRTHLCSL